MFHASILDTTNFPLFLIIFNLEQKFVNIAES